MKPPVLYIFNISHYCEKARWALEYFGIQHEARHVMPGVHRVIAKKLGAKRKSVPFLQTDDGVIAGSPAIIDWCELHNPGKRPSLPGADPAAVRATEKRLDDVMGVHVRRFYYSDALLTAPAAVRPIFSNGLPILGIEQGLQSRAVIEAELDWLDGLLADGRPYLHGDQWTRADLTAAALLGPLAAPKEHPMTAKAFFPAGVRQAMKDWEKRPTLQFVSRMYATHRL